MKGKYAAKAALRREDAHVRSEIEGYQHHVRRLTEENKKLRADLTAARAEHKAEVRRLKAQLDEGLSPEVLALREELERLRDRSDAAVRRSKETTKRSAKLVHFTSKLLHNITGCTGLEATERILQVVGGGDHLIVATGTGADDSTRKERPSDQIQALQRVRGFRSSQKVIEHLDVLVEAARPARGQPGEREDR